MPLCDVLHQGRAQRLIQRAVARDRVPHAYVFHGPDGIGKETLALGLAERLLCGAPVERAFDPERSSVVGIDSLTVGCGRCEDCRAVRLQTHPDLHVIYRQLNREHPDPTIRKRKALDIGVDVLRYFVIERVGLTPVRGRAKVFVVRQADRITTQAQNALLKTLEEPPGTTFLILLVTSLDRLLPTTLSRCQVVPFDALPLGFVRDGLRDRRPDLPAEQIEWYARFADGSLGRALQYAEDELYAVNERLLEGHAKLVAVGGRGAGHGGRPGSRDPEARSDKVAAAWLEESKALGERYRKGDPDITDTEAERRALQSILQQAAGWYADALRIIIGDTQAEPTHVRRTPAIDAIAAAVHSTGAIEAVNRIAAAEHQLDLNANIQLCIETLLTDLAGIGRNKTAFAGR